MKAELVNGRFQKVGKKGECLPFSNLYARCYFMVFTIN